MKIYYAIVGLAGFAVCFYLTNTSPHPPPWAAFLLGYVPGTLIGAAIITYLNEKNHP